MVERSEMELGGKEMILAIMNVPALIRAKIWSCMQGCPFCSIRQ